MSHFFTKLMLAATLTFLLLIGKPVSSTASPNIPACTLSGAISSNTVWSPLTCAVYVVAGDLTLNSGVQLTIQPGTRVQFDAGKSLLIYGELLARGEANQRIVFTSNQASPQPGHWKQLAFFNESVDASYDSNGNYLSGSILQYVTLEYGGGGDCVLKLQQASPLIDQAQIHHNGCNGIKAEGNSEPHITNSEIFENTLAGIDCSGCGPATLIYNNVIRNNQSDGVRGGQALVESNRIFGNQGTGIWQARRVLNNQITDNHQDGINGSAIQAIEGNGISGNQWYGIVLEAANDMQIGNNTIAGNQSGGLWVRQTLAHTTIENNQIEGNNTWVEEGLTGGSGLDLRCGEKVQILSNRIVKNISDGPAVDTPSGAGVVLNGPCVLTNNLIDNNTHRNTELNLLVAPATQSATIEAINNYWGSNLQIDIELTIWHSKDDSSLDLVNFAPFLGSEPSLSAPTVTVTPPGTATATPTVPSTSTPTPTPTTPTPSTPTPGTPTPGTPTPTTPTPGPTNSIKTVHLPLVQKSTPTPQWVRLGGGEQQFAALTVTGNKLWLGRISGGDLSGIYQAGTCQANQSFLTIQNNLAVYDVAFGGSVGVAATFNGGLHYSTNGGASWSKASTGLGANDDKWYAVTFADAAIYAGSSQRGIYVSNNNGANWAIVPNGPLHINRLLAEGNTLWVAAGIDTKPEGVRSFDIPTRRFQAINNGLSGNALLVHDILSVASNSTLYIATSNGVYRRTGTANWQAIGLQGNKVRSLALMHDRLMAGVEERGVWSANLQNPDQWREETAGPGWSSSLTVRKLLFDPTLCNGLVAATSAGVWVFR